MSDLVRFAVTPDPAQAEVFPTPRVITPPEVKELAEAINKDLIEASFSERQRVEIKHCLYGYAALTQEWQVQNEAAQQAELRGFGLRGRTYRFLEAARAAGTRMKLPKGWIGERLSTSTTPP